jgi:hypothetical protein
MDLLPEPPFIVLRAARGVPPGWMPPGLEGRWYYRADLLDMTARGWVREQSQALLVGAAAIARPTDRIEHRDYDGATAQVWEVCPLDGNYANDGDPHDRSGVV